MIETISNLSLYEIYWHNGLIRKDSGAKIVSGSTYYTVFLWEVVRDSIQAGVVSIHGQYKYRPKGDPGGEFNCSEWAALWWAEMIKTYNELSGYQLAAVPWAGALTYGYFTDMTVPTWHHGRDSMIVNVQKASGGYEKKIALIEPQRAPNHSKVIRLARGAGPDSEIGDGDSITFGLFP